MRGAPCPEGTGSEVLGRGCVRGGPCERPEGVRSSLRHHSWDAVSRSRRGHRRARLSVLLSAALVLAFVPFAAVIAAPAAPAAATTSLSAGALIIPMDTDTTGNHAAFNQNLGMWKAYGLLYRLLQNGVPVQWGISTPTSAINAVDISVPRVRDERTGTARGAWDYRGGPF